MIGNKYIACIPIDKLSALHLNSDKEQQAPQPRPPLSRIIPPPIAVEVGTNDGDNGSNDCGNQQDGCGYAPLIYSEEVFHEKSNLWFSGCKVNDNSQNNGKNTEIM